MPILSQFFAKKPFSVGDLEKHILLDWQIALRSTNLMESKARPLPNNWIKQFKINLKMLGQEPCVQEADLRIYRQPDRLSPLRMVFKEIDYRESERPQNNADRR